MTVSMWQKAANVIYPKQLSPFHETKPFVRRHWKTNHGINFPKCSSKWPHYTKQHKIYMTVSVFQKAATMRCRLSEKIVTKLNHLPGNFGKLTKGSVFQSILVNGPI